MRRLGIAILLMCLAGSAPAQPSAGKAFSTSLSPPPYGLTQARFELWVPETVSDAAPVRAVIACPRYQADRLIYELPEWRAFAAENRCALLRHDMRGTVAGRPGRLPVGDDATQALRDALVGLAAESGRPELATAPFVLAGLSQGGAQTTRLTRLMPHRVAAAIPFHGADFDGYDPDSPALRVPMLIPLGSQDDLTPRVWSQLPALLQRQPLFAALPQPNVPHHLLGEQDFVLAWLKAVLDARLDPDQPATLRALDHASGVAGDLRLNRRWLVAGVSLQPAAAGGAHWLPNEPVARAWAMAVRTGFVAGHEAREEIAGAAAPAPPTVRVDGDLREWGELPFDMRWPAQALPSGLNWRGPSDCGARFAVAHDAERVYIAVRVDDDSPDVRGEAPWRQDGIEARIDARPAPERMSNVGDGENDAFLLVAVGPGPGQPYLHDAARLPEGTQVAAASDASGYAVEIAIPVGYFSDRQGGDWSRFRLNLAVNDVDGDEGRVSLWWRPDWRSEQNVFGSGTLVRGPAPAATRSAPSPSP